MKEYYSHADYNRWARQYQYTLDIYLNHLNSLRAKLGRITWDGSAQPEIENDIYEIDRKLEEAVPRNFDYPKDTLTSSEVFAENLKILINLVCRYCNPKLVLTSIYEQEKIRAFKVNQEYQFEKKLEMIERKLDEVFIRQEAARAENISEEPPKQTAVSA